MFKLTKAQNLLVKQLFIMVILLAALLAGGALLFAKSSYVTEVGHFKEQPIHFSHETHANQVGMDCRFCHTGVEHSNSAGMPSNETCYGCHREVLSYTEYLKPIREKYKANRSLGWNRVNKLADHVHFNHKKHIDSKIACTTCHGDVAQMPLMGTANDFTMKYCLDCHRTQKEAPRLQDCYTCHR